jgi:hypothetical protein
VSSEPGAGHTSAALKALAVNGTKEDSALVRSYLNSSDYTIMGYVASFLGRFGESEDIPTILDLASKTWTNTDELISLVYRHADNPIAIVSDEMVHERLRAKFLTLLSDAEFNQLKDKWNSFLLEQDAVFRKRAVHRIVNATNLKERRLILSSYTTQSV